LVAQGQEVKLVAETVGISRSSLYYKRKPHPSRADRRLDGIIVEACGAKPAYGYRRARPTSLSGFGSSDLRALNSFTVSRNRSNSSRAACNLRLLNQSLQVRKVFPYQATGRRLGVLPPTVRPKCDLRIQRNTISWPKSVCRRVVART
jgi:hypothetical protein